MPPHYAKERSENDILPAKEAAGEETAADVQPLPSHADIDPLVTLRSTHFDQKTAAEPPAAVDLEKARKVRELKQQRDGIESLSRQRYGEAKQRFDHCHQKLESARAENDYTQEALLATRVAELKNRLEMAEKLLNHNLEDIRQIDCEIARLQDDSNPGPAIDQNQPLAA